MSLMSWRLPRARKASRSVNVEGFDGDPAGEERRDRGPAARGDDDLVTELDERAGGVRTDHAQPAGDEDHRITS
jgi:hypothetical protein